MVTEPSDAIATLVSLFPKQHTTSISPYSSTLEPLYAHYASALYSVCSPFLVDDHELAYIAAACWPNFVSPLLADWHAQTEHQNDADDTAMQQDSPIFSLPTEEARMRLVRYFTPSFTHALETLYPRTQHATQWSKEHAPPPSLRLSELLTHAGQNPNLPTRDGGDAANDRETSRAELTSIAKYVLVAAFLASFNPAKTDVRLLGRAPDERGKKRRRGGPRKSRGGGRLKVYSYYLELFAAESGRG